MFIVDISDCLFQMTNFLLHQRLQIRLVSTYGQTSNLLVLMTLFKRNHHSEIFPFVKSKCTLDERLEPVSR